MFDEAKSSAAKSSASEPPSILAAAVHGHEPPRAPARHDIVETLVKQNQIPGKEGASSSRPAEQLPVPVLWLWGGGPALVLLAATLMRTGADRQVLLPFWNVPLPETCAMYSQFGIDCPGCGLTRGFIHLAHANPLAAWRLNPLSWILFAYVALQIPLAIARARNVQSAWLERVIGVNAWGMMTIMIALVLRWSFNIAVGGW